MTPTPDQIKQARQQAGLTQTQFGAMVGASHKAVQAWEAGTRNMPPAKWELINIKLGITKMIYTAESYKKAFPQSRIETLDNGGFYVDEPEHEGPYWFYGPIHRDVIGRRSQYRAQNVKTRNGPHKIRYEETVKEA